MTYPEYTYIYPAPPAPTALWLSPAEYAIAEDLCRGQKAIMSGNTFHILLKQKYKLADSVVLTLRMGAHGH